MSFKRHVVSARRLDLEVVSHMTVDGLRDAIAGSKRARLSEIVTDSLSRDTDPATSKGSVRANLR